MYEMLDLVGLQRLKGAFCCTAAPQQEAACCEEDMTHGWVFGPSITTIDGRALSLMVDNDGLKTPSAPPPPRCPTEDSSLPVWLLRD